MATLVFIKNIWKKKSVPGKQSQRWKNDSKYSAPQQEHQENVKGQFVRTPGFEFTY